jgi:hypothetical protein
LVLRTAFVLREPLWPLKDGAVALRAQSNIASHASTLVAEPRLFVYAMVSYLILNDALKVAIIEWRVPGADVGIRVDFDSEDR